jgi:hypothetical protein
VGQVRLLTAQSARRLTAHPAESEHPGAEINHFPLQQSLQKHQKNLKEVSSTMNYEYLMDTAFLYILLIGGIIAITFVFIKKRRVK